MNNLFNGKIDVGAKPEMGHSYSKSDKVFGTKMSFEVKNIGPGKMTYFKMLIRPHAQARWYKFPMEGDALLRGDPQLISSLGVGKSVLVSLDIGVVSNYAFEMAAEPVNGDGKKGDEEIDFTLPSERQHVDISGSEETQIIKPPPEPKPLKEGVVTQLIICGSFG